MRVSSASPTWKMLMPASALLISASLLVGGCSWFWATSPQSGGRARVVVKVRWSDVRALVSRPAPTGLLWLLGWLQPPAFAAAGGEVDVVGARLVYPSEGAAFSQSVARQVAQDTGVITMDVPSSNYADLFVVGIQRGDHTGDRTLLFGTRTGISIPPGATVTFTIDQLSLIEPTWWVADATQWSQIQAGSLDAGGAQSITFEVVVRDPFQIGQQPSWDSLLIRVAGSGSPGPNPNGYRTFYMGWTRECKGNVSCGNEGVIQPYVAGSLFSLPKHAYIPPIIGRDGRFTVNY